MSIGCLKISSGEAAATSSMEVPPAGDAMKIGPPSIPTVIVVLVVVPGQTQSNKEMVVVVTGRAVQHNRDVHFPSHVHSLHEHHLGARHSCEETNGLLDGKHQYLEIWNVRNIHVYQIIHIYIQY